MRPHLIGVAIIALSGCALQPVRVSMESVRSKPLNYSEVSQFLKLRVQSRIGSRINYQRNTDGSKLFINFFFRNGNEPAYRTLIVTSNQIREISAYPNVWYDNRESAVFRLEGGKEWYE